MRNLTLIRKNMDDLVDSEELGWIHYAINQYSPTSEERKSVGRLKHDVESFSEKDIPLVLKALKAAKDPDGGDFEEYMSDGLAINDLITKLGGDPYGS